MRIYYAPNTRAVRIVWLFGELGLPYDLECFKLGDAAMRALEYLKYTLWARADLAGR
jgi:glutathione S-transferase